MYGYKDSKDITGQAGQFGLNTGFVTKFEFNPNGGQDGAAQDVIDLTIEADGKKYMKRFFPVSKVYAAKSGAELTDTTTEEYKTALNKAISLLNATLTDVVRCFVDEGDIKTALATPFTSFKEYAEILQRLVHSVPNFDKMPVDFFLQYQWTPKGDNKIAFLELPKDVKHGTFLIRSLGAGFNPVEGTIKFANAEGITHPFKRSDWFRTSAFTVQTKLNSASAPVGAAAMNQGTGSPAVNW